MKLRDDVYEGMDFLPAYYDYFLTSTKVYPGAVLYDEKLVGAMIAQIVDGGSTAITRGGRVKADYEGKGLMKALFYHLAQWAAKEGVNAIMSTADESKPATAKVEPGISPILTWRYIKYYFDENIAFKPEDVRYMEDLQIVSNENLSTLFKTKQIRDYIAPDGVLCINCVPLRPLVDNISCIKEPEDSVSTHILSNLYKESGQYRGLLSIGTGFKNLKGGKLDYTYCIDIFGTDESCVKKHIIRHLLVAKHRANGVVGVTLFCPKEIGFSKAKIVSAKYDIEISYQTTSTGPEPFSLHLREFWRRKKSKY